MLSALPRSRSGDIRRCSAGQTRSRSVSHWGQNVPCRSYSLYASHEYKVIYDHVYIGCTGLVVEDAPSGLRAGHAAGAKTLAVCTSHTRQEIEDSGAKPDWIVSDLTRCVRSCVTDLAESA